MNFKVGDRVRAIEAYDGKKEIVGKIGTVKLVNKHNDKNPYGIEFDENVGGHSFLLCGEYGHCWWCPENVIEPVHEGNKIVITTDGKTTTAKMYDGKKFVKSAKAVCSPDDKFDLGIGSALALERLVGNPKATFEKPKFTKSNLKNGMFVLLEDTCWGVVVDNRIVLENGRYCEINDFNTDLTSIFYTRGINAVVKADCFNRAKEYFKHAPDKVLFKR